MRSVIVSLKFAEDIGHVQWLFRFRLNSITRFFLFTTVGDLGNVLADDKGEAEGTLLARVPLKGKLGIRKNRAVVVHQGTDDFGLGGNAGSRAVGNAGPRPGCGTIK